MSPKLLMDLMPLLVLLMIAAMLVMQEAGRRIGRRLLQRHGTSPGTGAIEGAIFALLGLLIAFSFSGAAARFDHRRELIIEEGNCIGTAWLRLDLLPAEVHNPLREKFREYLAARLAYYRVLADEQAAASQRARADALQAEIWQRANTACAAMPDARASMLLLPALNAMFDIASTRNGIIRIHPPQVIYLVMAAYALISALLAGMGMAHVRPQRLHMALFAFVISLTMYLILDFEYPRAGMISIQSMDIVLEELQHSIRDTAAPIPMNP